MKTIIKTCSALMALSLALFANAETPRQPLKVLAIGNSFTISLMKELPACAANLPDTPLDLAVLYIGGCPLERHWSNVVKAKDPAYCPYSVHWSFVSAPDKANPPFAKAMTKNHANIPQMLAAQPWDIVTIQQVSHQSWKAESYQPYADNLIATIRKYAPQAEIRIQQTWAYCDGDTRICADCTPGKPGSWGINQTGMYEKLTAAYDALAQKHGFKVIPAGDAVQAYRKALPVTFVPPVHKTLKPGDKVDMGGDPVGSYYFPAQKEKGAGKLRADTIHLNREGQYLQACVWLAALFDNDLSKLTYKPDFLTEARARKMRQCAAEAAAKRRK